MSVFWTVLRRELRSFLLLPQSYGIAGAYFVMSGIFFVNVLVSTQNPELETYYANVANALLVLAPIVAMRSFAEDRRSGALDVALSWPANRTIVVLAKFSANTLFIWLVASIPWVYVRVISGFTPVQVGKVAAGYVGLLLLAASFSALALAVSARAESPVAAAFLGFGLLLTLWVLDFGPGFIGQKIRSLSPQVHLEPFRQGVIYSKDVLYFGTVVAVGLALAAYGLNRHQAGRKARRAVRSRAGIAATAVVWMLGSFTGSVAHAEVDLTSTRQFTATPATKGIVRRVHAPVSLIGFVNPLGSDASRLRALARTYQAAGVDMRLKIVDPDVELGLAHDYGVTGYGQYAVELDGKRELFDGLNQIAVTSAIMRLSRTAPPVICFTVGHGERDLESALRDGISALRGHLDRLGYRSEPIALGAPGGDQKLKTCTVVALVGPEVPLTEHELDLLQMYGRDRGRLLVVSAGAIADQLNRLLSPWKVRVEDGTVRDRSSLADDPGSVVSFDYASNSPITLRMLAERIPTVLVNPAPVVRDDQAGLEDGGWFTPLVQSSKKSWIETRDGKRRDGPAVLAAIVDRSRLQGSSLADSTIARTRIAVLGSADTVSNRSIDLFGNATLVTGVVQFLAMENDIVAAGRDVGGLYKVVLTATQRAQVVRRAIVLPTLAVLVPVPLVLWRLRRG